MITNLETCLSWFPLTADISTNVSTNPATYNNRHAFFEGLRKLFVTPAFKNIAKAKFRTLVQGASESTRAFHGLLQSDFNDIHNFKKNQIPWLGTTVL